MMIEHEIDEYLKQEWTGGADSLLELKSVTFLLQRAKSEIERLREIEFRLSFLNESSYHLNT